MGRGSRVELLEVIIVSERGEVVWDFLEQVARTACNLYHDDDTNVTNVEITRTSDGLWRAELTCEPCSEDADDWP